MEKQSTETTPLQPTTQTPATPGPSYVFPGVTPYSRRQQMKQFQCCMCTVMIGIIAIALVVAITYSGLDDNQDVNDTTDLPVLLPDPLNMSQLVAYILALKQPLTDEMEVPWQIEDPPLPVIEDAKAFGTRALGDKELFEENLETLPINSPSFRHYKAISTTREGRKLSRRGYAEYHATIHIAKALNYKKPIGRNNIGKGQLISFLNEPDERVCPPPSSIYRTDDGFCNNRKSPLKGSAYIPFRRAVAPDYGDGMSSPRLSSKGKLLPYARQVSLNIHRPIYSTDANFTVMLAVFGQFLDHDITATALSSGQEGESINCCTEPEGVHPECYPVQLIPGDPYFDFYNLTCMNFVRSAPAPTGRIGPREQLNQATAFIDGSVVYGSTYDKVSLLREKKNGTLRMFRTTDNRELLPVSSDPADGCNREDMNRQGKYCFDAGDSRANENLLLTSMHLILARQHNFLARGLQNENPNWKDEKLFQEARRILAAQMQHITYNEFLPILLGDKFAKSKGISSSFNFDSESYNENVDPSIANYFASSVFRFAHTLLPPLVEFYRNTTTPEYIELHTMLFNPFELYEAEAIDQVLLGAANTPVLKVNPSVNKELTEKLFERNTPEDIPPLCGLDLVSLNIQRGRDHGLPSYSIFRKHCKLPPADTWDQLKKTVDLDSFKSMKAVYESPLDIDLYTGALSEPPLEGAIFGPLLTCLVSDQFLRLKAGDSHWYERIRGTQRFSRAQLKEIWKTSLAGIICQNSDGVQKVQKYVMHQRNEDTNPFVNCEELGKFNFLPWSESYVKSLFTKVKISHDGMKVLVKDPKSSKF
ncbi:HPX6 family protein [Megaselia abdita]